MRIIALVVAAATLAGTAGDAAAQYARRYAPTTAPSYGANSTPPRYPDRGYQQYSQPPGQTGIIRWNSPNADGNLGGPGAGGGGGGGR